MEKIEMFLNKTGKYLPYFFVASFTALLGYIGYHKNDLNNESYMKFNLDDSLYVHADDPQCTSYSSSLATLFNVNGCGGDGGSTGDGGSGDGGGDA